MKQGFVKVAAASCAVVVADVRENTRVILETIHKMEGEGAKVMVLPELALTGYTCSDLFWQSQMIDAAKEGLKEIADGTKETDALIFVGLPWEQGGKLFNVAAVLCHGELLGIVPKKYLPNYNEFYELRHFTPGKEAVTTTEFFGKEVPFGMNLLFQCEKMPRLKVAAELCEDLWTPNPPSVAHALAGATVVVNLSASDEMVGKDSYRRSLVSAQSARLICGYIYATAGEGESTTDLVFGGQHLIAENGTILAEAKRFENQIICADLDVDRLTSERRRMTTYPEQRNDGYQVVRFSLSIEETKLTRYFDPRPFVPSDKHNRDQRCDEILNIQAMGLKKRLEHTHCRSAVIGISGGLDSTLALLVTVRAFDLLGMDHKNIKAVTMPGFGTTDRTYDNAVSLIKCLNADFMEVSIRDAVNIHFRDIGQDPSVHDVTYENGQARERTQILMDIANKTGGMVIGTGDLSELALGWATYNGDHMSMYAVNASVPKTLVRHLVRYYADTCGDEALEAVLLDVLDTPVSPELLPPEDGKISQKTEDLVGPYELHDFYLYHMLRLGYAPAKIYRLAKVAFAGTYDDETILKWLKTFYRRIFCTAVQTFLPAGWTKSRKRCCLSARRSAYAFGCVCTDLDGRTGGIKHREEIAACNIGKINMETIFLRWATAVCVLRKRGTAQTIDKAEKEVMAAIEAGVNYFDTAYVYAGNEVAVGEILHRNHCREKINLATKLPHYLIKSIDGVEKMFQEELRRLQTDYIDYYLMHMLTDIPTWEKLKKLGMEEWIREKKASGQIRQIGFSYHGNSAMFCQLVDAYDWDFCQIQYNYMDEHSQAGVEGLRYANRKGLPVIIMEPLRGGRLVNLLPESAKELFRRDEKHRTPAELALKWLYDQPEVTCVLSGMKFHGDGGTECKNCQRVTGGMSHTIRPGADRKGKR